MKIPYHPELRGSALLDVTLEFLAEHRELHAQETYGQGPEGVGECEGFARGTMACVAGWAAIIGGAEISYNSWGEMQADGDLPRFAAVNLLQIPMERTACRWSLDDDGYIRRGLFHPDNTFEDLQAIATEIREGSY